MSARVFLILLICIFFTAYNPTNGQSQEHQLKIVVSIKPIHSLVSALTRGIVEPALLLEGTQSPHNVQLKPSQVRLIRDADLVVWMGPELEAFLRKPLVAHQETERVLELALMNTKQRAGKKTEDSHAHSGKEYNEDGHHKDLLHGWLDPGFAGVMVERITDRLVLLNPENAEQYQDNRKAVLDKLAVLDMDIANIVRPLREKKVIFFHDAYGRFEHRYSITAETFVLRNPHAPLGLKHARNIRSQLEQSKIDCIFSEPQFSAKLLANITNGTSVKTVELDPLGARIASGPDQYFRLMRNLARAMQSCLS